MLGSERPGPWAGGKGERVDRARGSNMSHSALCWEGDHTGCRVGPGDRWWQVGTGASIGSLLPALHGAYVICAQLLFVFTVNPDNFAGEGPEVHRGEGSCPRPLGW